MDHRTIGGESTLLTLLFSLPSALRLGRRVWPTRMQHNSFEKMLTVRQFLGTGPAYAGTSWFQNSKLFSKPRF